MPIAYGVALDIGNSDQFGTYDEQRVVVKLLKEIHGSGIAHLGFEVRERR